jgi:hypothetical protein
MKIEWAKRHSSAAYEAAKILNGNVILLRMEGCNAVWVCDTRQARIFGVIEPSSPDADEEIIERAIALAVTGALEVCE